MEDRLACPYCHGDLEIKGDAFCKNCKKLFRKKGNFIDFRVEDFLKGGNALQMRLYNAYATFYDRLDPLLAKVIGFTEDALRKELVGEMGIRKGNRILGVCIGTGSNVPYFKDRKASLIAGVDISEEMPNRCAEKFPDIYLFLVCVEALPFKDNTFDRILIGGGVAHMRN